MREPRPERPGESGCPGKLKWQRLEPEAGGHRNGDKLGASERQPGNNAGSHGVIMG